MDDKTFDKLLSKYSEKWSTISYSKSFNVIPKKNLSFISLPDIDKKSGLTRNSLSYDSGLDLLSISKKKDVVKLPEHKEKYEKILDNKSYNNFFLNHKNPIFIRPRKNDKSPWKYNIPIVKLNLDKIKISKKLFKD